MSFTFEKAVREDVRLLIGIAGPTGGGKSRSAMRLATGLTGGRPFAYIDTENGRAKLYADAFDFHHCDLTPPFTPERYTEAIEAASEAGYSVIVVDSASHEHAGMGGLLDMHEDILARRAGDDWKRRDSLSMAAWVEPKREHSRFVDRLTRLRAHVILCFRAAERVEMATEKGRTVIRPKKSRTGLDGWVPIAEKTLPYELTTSLLVLPERPGVPVPIKLPEELQVLLPLDQPLNEEAGAKLAEWAKGDVKENPEIAVVRTELLDLADQLDVRDTVTAGIQKNRHRNNDAEHLAWLTQKRDDAKDAVESMDLPDVDLKPEGDE